MLNLGMGLKVFIAPGSTDMRKSIRGLSLTITQILKKDPRCGHVFAFCNRRQKLAKILLYDGVGFWLILRKLDQRKFCWPQAIPGQTELEVDVEQLSWLLSGLDWQKLAQEAGQRVSPSFQEQHSEILVPDFLDLL
jgi:transposase